MIFQSGPWSGSAGDHGGRAPPESRRWGLEAPKNLPRSYDWKLTEQGVRSRFLESQPHAHATLPRPRVQKKDARVDVQGMSPRPPGTQWARGLGLRSPHCGPAPVCRVVMGHPSPQGCSFSPLTESPQSSPRTAQSGGVEAYWGCFREHGLTWSLLFPLLGWVGLWRGEWSADESRGGRGEGRGESIAQEAESGGP